MTSQNLQEEIFQLEKQYEELEESKIYHQQAVQKKELEFRDTAKMQKNEVF